MRAKMLPVLDGVRDGGREGNTPSQQQQCQPPPVATLGGSRKLRRLWCELMLELYHIH